MDVRKFLEKRGWTSGVGADFYFDGNGMGLHPHLHLRLKGRKMHQDIGNPMTHIGTKLGYGRLAPEISMLAWSDHHGHTYVESGAVIPGNFKQATTHITASTTVSDNDSTLGAVLAELDYIFRALGVV